MIPANPSIRFEHTIKKTTQKGPAGSMADLMESMKNTNQKEEEEEYTNSALLIYTINGQENSTYVYPGDWVVVYTDGMVVIKKQEQFIREYNEFNPQLHQNARAEPQQSTVHVREEESPSNAHVDDPVHNPPG
jgi:hypothetical protein